MKSKKTVLAFALLAALLMTFAPALPALAADYEAKLEGQLDTDVNPDVPEWGIGDLPGAVVSFNLGEEAVITMEFDAPVKFTGNWTGIATNVPVESDEDAEAVMGGITSFKVDGKEIGAFKVPLINRDNSGYLTIDIARQWGGEYDAFGLIDMEPFSKIEIGFALGMEINYGDDGGDPEPPPADEKPPIPAFDPNGTYGAFFGIQVNNIWHYRDEWAHETNGFGSENFGVIFDNENDGPAPGTVTDAVLAGNGTYRVGVKGLDISGGDVINLLYFSTDVPTAGEPLQITEMKVYYDGNWKYTFNEDEEMVPYVMGITGGEHKDYYQVYAIHAWNNDLKAGFFGQDMSVKDIELVFTVTGFAYDKAEEAAPPAEDEAPASDNAAPSPDAPADTGAAAGDDEDGGFPSWAIGLIIAGAAALIGVVIMIAAKKGKK